MPAVSPALRALTTAICALLLAGAAQAGDPARPAVATLSPVDAPLPSRDLVLEGGVPVPPAEWRALTEGRTVWYFARDGLWGRELYRLGDAAPDGGFVTFEHRGGECLDARWRYEAGLYCFDFGAGPAHCFRHMRWQDRLFAISTSGDVQEVKRIDRSGVSCGAPPVS